MTTQNGSELINQSNASEIDAVLEIINTLARKSSNRSYIYRGETVCNDKVSSSLYREYENVFSGIVRNLDIDDFQQMRLDTSKLFTAESDEWEILTQIQHYGGNTNLIDFTRDYLIALFFACDGNHAVPGRVILLDGEGDMHDYIMSPIQPANRIIAQKSVFVRHPEGVVSPDDIVEIPAKFKLSLLEYLDSAHGISVETMYNDLHGYIRYRARHSEAFAKLNEAAFHHSNGDYKSAIEKCKEAIDLSPRLAIAYVQRGNAYGRSDDHDKAITDYSDAIRLHPGLMHAYRLRGLTYAKKGDYRGSVADFTTVLDIDPDLEAAYCDRAEARLHLSEWDDAREDLAIAQDLDVDIVASFRNDYDSVEDFEQRNGITVPPDIAEMLGG